MWCLNSLIIAKIKNKLLWTQENCDRRGLPTPRSKFIKQFLTIDSEAPESQHLNYVLLFILILLYCFNPAKYLYASKRFQRTQLDCYLATSFLEWDIDQEMIGCWWNFTALYLLYNWSSLIIGCVKYSGGTRPFPTPLPCRCGVNSLIHSSWSIKQASDVQHDEWRPLRAANYSLSCRSG